MSFTPLARAGRKYEASVSLSCLCTVGTLSKAGVVVASSAETVMARGGEREDEEGCELHGWLQATKRRAQGDGSLRASLSGKQWGYVHL